MPSVFLSHSSEDNDFCEGLARDLLDNDVQVWYDEWEIKIGDSLRAKIAAAIAENDHLAVVLSRRSVQSQWVQQELNTALAKELDERRVVVLPLLIEDCEIPTLLKDKKYADFRENYHLGLTQLMDVLGTKGRVEQRSSFVVRAVPGSGFALLESPETYAQLAIRNRGLFLSKCSVRLESLHSILPGGTLVSENLQPRPLHWSSREASAYGEFHQWLDIANDSLEYFVDVAAVASANLEYFRIVSANHEDRPVFGPGWYKLTAVVVSETESPNPKRIQLLLGLHPRNASIPAPLELYDWALRGENLINHLASSSRE